MTHEDLVQLARRGGVVRWNLSGIIEKLWIGRFGDVMASRLLDGFRPHPIHPRDEHRCREVSLRESFSVGEYCR